MGAMKENPRYRIVSMRVTDEEKELIQRKAKDKACAESDLLRDAAWDAGLLTEED